MGKKLLVLCLLVSLVGVSMTEPIVSILDAISAVNPILAAALGAVSDQTGPSNQFGPQGIAGLLGANPNAITSLLTTIVNILGASGTVGTNGVLTGPLTALDNVLVQILQSDPVSVTTDVALIKALNLALAPFAVPLAALFATLGYTPTPQPTYPPPNNQCQ